MYIVNKKIWNTKVYDIYFIKLNRTEKQLDIYKKVDVNKLRDKYPVRNDFFLQDYIAYEKIKSIPCIFGASGDRETPFGTFMIEKISYDEYVSPYHPVYEKVKFFGYMVIFEDYYIHSDMYMMEANINNYKNMQSISLQDKYTAGCVRVSRDSMEWLLNNIPVGTVIEL